MADTQNPSTGSTKNLGNVAGVVKGLTPPLESDGSEKRYVLWAKEIPTNPVSYQLMYYDLTKSGWYPIIGASEADFNLIKYYIFNTLNLSEIPNILDERGVSNLIELFDNKSDVNHTHPDLEDYINDLQSGLDNQVVINENQDDRLENIEGENVAQNDLISDLFSEIQYEKTRNDIQDSMLGNLEGGLATKLDKGAYTGNASDLKSLIDTKADLVSGKVPASQLPAYVDDVLEFANLASFPATGENGKIYIALDTNLTYRWGGSSYVVMSSSLALGETSSTAYRGDRGKIAYDHSQATGSNPHGTELEQLSDVSGTANSIVDTDEILKKETGGLWKKITFANFKNWFTTELAKKINIGLDSVFNFKNISAMTLTEFRSIIPNIETIYFTEEQNGTGWQQVRYNGLGITIPATTETLVSLTNENFIELDSDSTFNLIDVENTKINGIFERDFVIIKFNAGVVTPATANQWFKVILKINDVQTAVSPVFYLTETSGTVEQIAHNFALNVPTEMVTNGATLHLKTSAAMTFNNPSISVVRVHKSTSATL